jgi:hypothetical protein
VAKRFLKKPQRRKERRANALKTFGFSLRTWRLCGYQLIFVTVFLVQTMPKNTPIFNKLRKFASNRKQFKFFNTFSITSTIATENKGIIAAPHLLPLLSLKII